MHPKTQTHRLIGPDPTGRYLKRRIEEPQILRSRRAQGPACGSNDWVEL